MTSQFADQMIKGTPNDPNASVTIGRDGACLKCHVENDGVGLGVGKSY